jgi:uncharacterized damage-inducible protein DinB
LDYNLFMTPTRVLIPLVLILMLGLPLAAQDQPAAPANPLSTDAYLTWGYAKSIVMRAAEKMPEENYAFKPVPEVRSFAQVVVHILVEQNDVCASIKGVAKPAAPSEKATKAEVIAALRESDALCDAAFAGLTDANATAPVKFWGATHPRVSALNMLAEHDGEHYGNLVTYMRLKGLVPPTSEPRK